MAMSMTIHATCIAIGDKGVLIEGESGSGKSDLALRMIDRGATLVSDDYTELAVSGERLIARPPSTIAGRIEVRGIGIVSVVHRHEIPVDLVVTLSEAPPRMPELAIVRQFLGIDIPQAVLDPRLPSAPIKVELALSRHILAA